MRRFSLVRGIVLAAAVGLVLPVFACTRVGKEQDSQDDGCATSPEPAPSFSEAMQHIDTHTRPPLLPKRYRVYRECVTQPDLGAPSIYFDNDQATPRSDQVENLDKVVQGIKLLIEEEHLESDGGWRILVVGQCDDIGSSEYNIRLGERRAQSVADYLISHGIPEDHIDLKSDGEGYPGNSEHTKAARKSKRRVTCVYID